MTAWTSQDCPLPFSATSSTGPLNVPKIPRVRICVSQAPAKKRKNNLNIEKLRDLATQETEDGKSQWEIVRQLKKFLHTVWGHSQRGWCFWSPGTGVAWQKLRYGQSVE